MTPDKKFVADLKKIDSKLAVEWSPKMGLFVIWYTNPQGEKFRIHEVKNTDGSFKQLDKRTLDLLRRADMSTKIEDPKYFFSKHYQQVQIEKQKQIDKQREEHLYRSKQLMPKWKKAIENAERGIVRENQVQQPKIYSLPEVPVYRKLSAKLLNKLGRPNIKGEIKQLNPNKGVNNGRIIKPNQTVDSR